MNLREIASTGEALDTTVYSLADYPTTLAVLDGAGAVEIQLADPNSDRCRAGIDAVARTCQPAARPGV